MSEKVDLKSLKGLIATVVTTGNVESMFAQCREDMRSFHDRNGFHNIEYRQFDAKLVEAGRDAAVEHFLSQKDYAWIVQVDADATFSPDSVVRILETAFNLVPSSDMVGAYCQLKGGANLPTIDTGSGKWEVHYPGEGVIPVIRTGAHFILCKRSAFEKMGAPPWFRTRVAPRAIDVLAELDGIARQNFDGQNPFWKGEWDELLEKASKNAKDGPSGVGEDSGFADRLKACGGQIWVDTNITTGHVSKKVIVPQDLIDAINRHERQYRLACGVMD